MVSTETVVMLDTSKLRRLAEVMITRAGKYDDDPKLLDLSQQSPAELLKAYAEKVAAFDTAPFDPAGEKLRFYDGGYTIWSGYPGTGKTTLLRQLECHLLHCGKGVFVAHLEEDPGDSLIRAAGVAFGTHLPTLQQLQWFMDFYTDSLRVWGIIGLVNHRDIFGTVQALAEKGVKHFIVDSLMCLDVQSDDYEAQRKFANALSSLVRTTKTHVHLVAHPRKVISSDQEPDINDVAGSSDLIRLADSVLFVRRGPSASTDDQVTAMQIIVKKNRHDPAFIGNIVGWFNRPLRQFKKDQFDQRPTQYLPKQAYA